MNYNYNDINDDIIKNFDITDQLISNNPSNQNDIIMNYINLILNNANYYNRNYNRNGNGNGNGNGNNINVYNNYRSDRLVTDTTIKNNPLKEKFLDYYSI